MTEPEQPAPSTREQLSIGIPAFNEAEGIARLLPVLQRESHSLIAEILVCANGCTDATETIVEEWTTRDGRIRLLRSPQGKPSAWNQLLASSRSDLMIMLDADVLPRTGSLAALAAALDAAPVAIVCGMDVASQREPGLRHWLLAIANEPLGRNFLCGRFYGLRKSLLLPFLAEIDCADHDRARMPLDLLHEDFWLEVVVPRSAIAFAPTAIVGYEPGTLRDLIRSRARLRVAREQVAARHPALYHRWQRETGTESRSLPALRQRLQTLRGVRTSTRALAGLMLRRLLLAHHASDLDREVARMRAELAEDGGAAVLGGSGRLGSKTTVND